MGIFRNSDADGGMMPQDDEYWEDLPAACPPEHAVDQELGPVYRLLESATPTEGCFASKAVLGKPKPFKKAVDDCKWASCSLFNKYEVVSDLMKLPRMRKRYSHIATMHFPFGAGRHVIDGAHVDFWCYAGYDICSAVSGVEAA